ncbi:MAG: hypothetical protein QGF74_00095 [Candidatus Nanoarchaeia archaeon]|jgi:hypothetical protein|nr:hypothetical protein [Candidatus Nanoarchaeia archaeon]|tara:strand:+ start:12707 stop:13021 length:315 start_codon:yes stop_codon:yes gene_type:complete
MEKWKKIHCDLCKKIAGKIRPVCEGINEISKSQANIQYFHSKKKIYKILYFCSVFCALKKYFEINKKKWDEILLGFHLPDKSKFYYTLEHKNNRDIIKRESMII